MCSVISVVFGFIYIIFCAKNAGATIIEAKSGCQKLEDCAYNIKKNEKLQIIFGDMQGDINDYTTHCDVRCTVNNKQVNPRCTIKDNVLKVTTQVVITEEHSGTWYCDFNVRETREGKRGEPLISSETKSIKSSLSLTVEECYILDDIMLSPKTNDLICLSVSGVLIVTIFIIIFQCVYIVRLRKKYKAVILGDPWCNKKENEDVNVTVRYSKMPGIKKQEVLIPTARESTIYEVLENIRAVPEPPPVESMPTKKAMHKSTDSLDSTVSTPKDKTNPFNSWLKKKNMKKNDGTESKTSTLDNRSSMERIKERPPLAPPPVEDDVYEAMEESPTPARKKYNRPAAKDNTQEDLRGFPVPTPKLPIPTNAAIVTPLNTQLKQALEKKNLRQAPATPAKPRPAKEPAHELMRTLEKPNGSPVPNPKWPKKPAPKVWQREEEAKGWGREQPGIDESAMGRGRGQPAVDEMKRTWGRGKPVVEESQRTWGKQQSDEPQRTWGREKPEEPKRFWHREQADPRQEDPPGRPRLKLAPINPGLPPPDAAPGRITTPWGETLPPKPRFPKPIDERTHIPVQPAVYSQEPDLSDQDSDSEWVYEQLPQYNIYNV